MPKLLATVTSLLGLVFLGDVTQIICFFLYIVIQGTLGKYWFCHCHRFWGNINPSREAHWQQESLPCENTCYCKRDSGFTCLRRCDTNRIFSLCCVIQGNLDKYSFGHCHRFWGHVCISLETHLQCMQTSQSLWQWLYLPWLPFVMQDKQDCAYRCHVPQESWDKSLLHSKTLQSCWSFNNM